MKPETKGEIETRSRAAHREQPTHKWAFCICRPNTKQTGFKMTNIPNANTKRSMRRVLAAIAICGLLEIQPKSGF